MTGYVTSGQEFEPKDVHLKPMSQRPVVGEQQPASGTCQSQPLKSQTDISPDGLTELQPGLNFE